MSLTGLRIRCQKRPTVHFDFLGVYNEQLAFVADAGIGDENGRFTR